MSKDIAKINQQLFAECFEHTNIMFCTQPTKAYVAKTSCSLLLILDTSWLTICSPALNSEAMSHNDISTPSVSASFRYVMVVTQLYQSVGKGFISCAHSIILRHGVSKNCIHFA